MKYLLTFVRDQDRMYDATEEEMKQAMDAWNAFDKEAIEAGALIANEPLEPPKGAKTIRIDESGEQTIIEAIGWAKKVPMGTGAIEVRAVMDLSPYGYESSSPGPIKP